MYCMMAFSCFFCFLFWDWLKIVAKALCFGVSGQKKTECDTHTMKSIPFSTLPSPHPTTRSSFSSENSICDYVQCAITRMEKSPLSFLPPKQPFSPHLVLFCSIPFPFLLINASSSSLEDRYFGSCLAGQRWDQNVVLFHIDLYGL